jgi:excisionase family DNA binding protein
MFLPMPGFTVRESAKYLGIRRETVFAWIHSKKIQAEVDCVGQYKIPYGELYRLLHERESKESERQKSYR